MKLGEKLNFIIKKKGMTVNQVAIEANVPPSSLYSIIQRNSTKVEIGSFIRICNVLDCKPEDFSDEILAASNRDSTPILSNDEKQLINYYRNFNEEGRNQLMQQAIILSKVDEYKKCFDIEQDIG